MAARAPLPSVQSRPRKKRDCCEVSAEFRMMRDRFDFIVQSARAWGGIN